MTETISIPISQKDKLREFYVDNIRKITLQIEELERERDEFRMVIERIDGKQAAPIYEPSLINGQYDKNWSYTEKVLYFTDLYGWLMTSEISNYILKEEPDLKEEDVLNNLSVTLSQDARRGVNAKFERRKNEYKKFDYKRKTH